jgi:hypothetical protein
VSALFREYGKRDDFGRPCFPSLRAFLKALELAELTTGSRDGQLLVRAIERQFGGDGGPLVVRGESPRVFKWIGSPEEQTPP